MGRPPKNVVVDNPTLISEWDYSENIALGLNPSILGCNSHKHAKWICRTCGHKWTAEIKARNHGNGCPTCGRERQIQTLNDNLLKKSGSLFDNNPELASEWHPTMNKPVTPRDVLVNSGKSYAWLCKKCGYVWKQRVSVRNRGSGCPACANMTVVKGFNDLATINPWLTLEWHPSLNGELKPDQVVYGSSKKVYWKCRICGNVWKATVDSRNRGNGCKKCFYEQQVSFQEKAVLYFVKNVFPSAVESYQPNWLAPKELDIFIPEMNIGIEYDGAEWHTDSLKDIRKDEICLAHGIDVIHLREPLCPKAKFKTAIYLSSRSTASLEQGITELLILLQHRTNQFAPIPKIDVLENTVSILMMMQLNAKQKSLAVVYPELAKEWDYQRNFPLIPEQFSAVSGQSVYWKCELGHQWRARIANRKNGNGCPYCSGRTVLVGFNDLASQNPKLASEWHPDLNKCSPSDVIYHSNKKAYWQCDKGHTWEASPNSRSKGTGCPYCTNRKVWKGYNDFASQFPELAKEWNQERNGSISPDEVIATSASKYWWHCSICGNDWCAEVRSRAKGYGCPSCAGNAPMTQQSFVERMARINPNIEIIGQYVNSNTRISCKCRICGYEWSPVPSSILKGYGCKKCYHNSRRKVTNN